MLLAAALILLTVVAVRLWPAHEATPGAAPGPGPVAAGDSAHDRRRASMPVMPAPIAGSLSLRGRVLDRDGAPIEGATVRLASPARELSTGAGGTFAFDELPAGAYLLSAHHQDRAAGPLRVHLDDGSGPVDLRLFAAARLRIRVVSAADSRPIAGARVQVRSTSMPGDPDVRTGDTDADGVLEMRALAPGTWAVGAAAPGFRTEDQPLPPQAGLDWSIELRLLPGAPVHGRVSDATGAPVAGAVVRAFPAEIELLQVARPEPGRLAVVTDQAGAFTVPALETGAHSLVATHPAYLPGTSVALELDGRTPKHGVEIRLERGASVAGRVVDAAGVPVPGAVVRTNAVDPVTPGAGSVHALTGTGGEFLLAGLPEAEVDLVAATASASSDEHRVDLSATPVVEGVELALVFTDTIEGVVTDAEGAPIPDAQVVCVGEMRGAIGTRPILPETSDAAGRFACRGLAPGEYELTAMRPYPNNNISPWMRSAGAVALAGDHDVAIVIPDDGALTGTVYLADGTRARSFGVSLDRGGEPRAIKSDDGRFHLDGLAPRSYDVEIGAPGARPVTVRGVLVPEGGAHDLGEIRLGAP
jgi:protocatechuate 3,4-dioxygenase beta subunit